jgi:uncharacterized protein (TIGR00299 family) protein
MVLGALLDAGLSFDTLSAEIGKLPLPPDAYALSTTRVSRAGIAATKLDVQVTQAPRHRSLAEVLAVIGSSGLPEADRDRIAAVFRRLGEAEAKVHGQPLDEVELHEVGAIDAMVDITGAVVGLRLLGVEAVYCSPLPLGHGEVRGSHGMLPVPAPATLELIAAAGAPTAAAEGPRGEALTPTGAAILTTLARFERPALQIDRVGYGAGGRDPADRPNVLRVWLGEASTPLRRLRLVETNVDDSTPELLAYAQERLITAGAADVWFTAIQMKKNRPAVLISVLCDEGLEREVVDILLAETTTLGVRVREVSRYEAAREVLDFESSLGPATVKVKRLPGQPARFSPEFEVCRQIAAARALPLAEVYRIVEAEAAAHFGRG